MTSEKAFYERANYRQKKRASAKDGVHNRITVNIPLLPFTLSETAAYLNYRDN